MHTFNPGAPFAAAILFAVAAAGCSKAPEKPTWRGLRVMTVQRAAVADLRIFAGDVRPRYETDLAFRIGGKVLERKVDMGARVARGQPLARLDPQDARLSAAASAAQVAAADADVALAQSELDRSRQLLERKFISQAAYDAKRSTFDVAVAKRASARAQSAVSANQASYTTLVADSAGVITAVLAEAGQVVGAGQAVMKLARTEEREVAINVAEGQSALLKPGNPAQVSLWADPARIYRGVVREVAPAADALTRTYTVRVSVPDADDAFRWGMTANVAIAAPRSSAVAADAIVVPLTAINQQGTGTQVWIVGDRNAVQPRAVLVAQYLENGAVIAQGLSGGERIVIAGVHKLHAGEVVAPLAPEALPSVAAPTEPAATPVPPSMPMPAATPMSASTPAPAATTGAIGAPNPAASAASRR